MRHLGAHHLHQDASNHHKPKDVCADVRELVVPAQRQLESDTEALAHQ
jgi:hypothetical protein